MKIHGQDLRDILRRLPWQYKIVVAAAVFFIPLSLVQIPSMLMGAFRDTKPPVAGPLEFIGTGEIAPGALDPALATDNKNHTAWMAYTAEEKNGVLQPRLAQADTGNKCRDWRQQNLPVFEAKSGDILAPDGQTVFRSGGWRVETPAIVHDPDDPGKEWKVYAYKYFWANDTNARLQVAQHYGMIVYKYATDPVKGWSTEQWLFSPAPDYPPMPYEPLVLLHLNRLSPALQDVVTYARPSVIYRDGVLVMTLSAFTGGESPDRVIIIVSRDHGNSWLYLGAPLSSADLPGIAVGDEKGIYTKIGGASLIEQKGEVYLAAVLGDDAQRGRGTFIFGFDDLGKGTLKRDRKTGAPLVLNHVPLQETPASGAIGGGFAAYTDACPFGLLTSQQVGEQTFFRIFKTYQQPVK